MLILLEIRAELPLAS